MLKATTPMQSTMTVQNLAGASARDTEGQYGASEPVRSPTVAAAANIAMKKMPTKPMLGAYQLS